MAAPIHTVKRAGSRFYVNPATRVTVPGVTSVIGMLDKPFLPAWSAKLAAELAVDSFDLLLAMEERAGRQAVVDYIKGAAQRYTRARSSIGSEAHEIFERMIKGDAVGAQRSDLEPYRSNFAEFLDVVQPTLVGAEDIAWSDSFAYAGSFDAMLEVPLSAGEDGNVFLDHEGGTPTLVIGDWKTGKSTYSEVALQLAAYSHADRIIRADGSETPMPAFGGAAVLHITDEQWAFKPVRSDGEVFEFFVALRKVFGWTDFGKDVIGRPLASGGRVDTGTARRK